MFERYTEKARRVIFFGRYEASQFGSPYIETEHLLLGLLREDKGLSNKLLPIESAAEIRRIVELRTGIRERVSTSVDLPLSNECKGVLAYAAEEAESLGHRYIGTEHLLLGLFREKDSFGAELLTNLGLSVEKTRQAISSWPVDLATSSQSSASISNVEVHGKHLPLAAVTNTVNRMKQFAWVRREWRPLDVVVDNQDGGICFDLSVRDDTRYKFVVGGWTKEPCAICGWELSVDGGPEHSEGFTNGRRWLCAECYHRFISTKSAGAA